MADTGSSGSSAQRLGMDWNIRGGSVNHRCPFGRGEDACPFTGTEDEVDNHVTYMASIGDEDHQEGNRRT